ncbi:MAG: hypothetical protein H6842_11235 [Rhodospirillaceae bacterium]|nr:hypothetical protein [Rhodospirillaceae bacterium]
MTQMIASNGFPLDVFDPAFLLIDTVITAGASGFVYETSAGTTVSIWGSGFSYDGTGQPTGGDVSVITIHDSLGNEVASFTLAAVDLADLLANGGSDFWEVLFAGDDAIFAHDGDDTLSGFDGNDRLYGKGGHDTLLGGQGEDVIDGGTGDDIIDAGADDDLIIVHAGQGNDTIDGGSGFDTVAHHGFDSSSTGDVITVGATRGRDPSVSLGMGAARDGKGGKGDGLPHTQATLDNVERLEINGNDGDDALHVFDISSTDLGAGQIVFDGGLGTDDVHAAFATTSIEYIWRFAGDGHPGDGTVDFGSGFDRFTVIVEDDGKDMDLTLSAGGGVVEVSEGLFGGKSTGTVTMTGVDGMSFELAGGDDSVVINGDLGGEFSGGMAILFGGGQNTLTATDHTGSINVSGGDGTNIFQTGSGADLLSGGAANDHLSAGDGNDWLLGHGGDDVMNGGSGADRFIFEAGSGHDTIEDFEAGPGGGDVLDFSTLGITIGDLVITQIAGDTQIATPDGDTILLQGVLPGQLDSGDFLF